MGRLTDLLAKPLQVQISQIMPVELDRPSDWIVEPEKERDDGRLARSRGTHQRRGLSRREGRREVGKDGDAGSTWIMEGDSFKGESSFAGGGLDSSLVGAVDGRDAVDRFVEL